MACDTKTWLVLHVVLLVTCYMQHCINGQTPQVPCIFVFGDSLSDNGNNNNLLTNAKANYDPYGVDFPTGSNGSRFTNGRTSIDYIGEFLGFTDFIPPFANTNGSNISHGVNYASGSAGISFETAKHMGDNVPLLLQLIHHNIIVSKIALMLGGLPQAQQYLKKCLYYVNIGSNDYINNYYLPQFYPSSRLFNPEQYAQVLSDQFSFFLQALHAAGARKHVIVGVGLIGCTPNAIATKGLKQGELCVEQYNADSLILSLKLRALVDRFNTEKPDSKYIFVNSTAGSVDPSLGFTVFNAPCCPVRSDGMCVRDSIPCTNRNQHVFHDGFHPTQALNYLTALTSYDSTFAAPGTTSPMDIKQLAQYPIN
ncbi:GDSL esterase/lipase At1g29670-like [Trifolium pratense]|nr:GDSL esterase/lipase At1g29670-like [Trifolium pratense]